MFDNEELPGTVLPVTPVYRVLSAGRLRIVEAHDQKVKIGVIDLGCDLVELAMMHRREIDVEVDPGKWVRVRPDGSMMPAPRPGAWTASPSSSGVVPGGSAGRRGARP